MMSRMKNMKIYQTALDLIGVVYAVCDDNAALRRDYSLSDQIKRASVSVACNIAEGYCRSRKQFQHYLEISSGSTNEVVALLHVIQMVYKQDTLLLQEKYTILGRQIRAFSKNLITATPNS
jgi:four helix bundle protein